MRIRWLWLFLSGAIGLVAPAAAAADAGLEQIDYLLTTHYHLDHVGGTPEVAARLPIRNFVDHGLPTTTELDSNQPLYDAYVETRKSGRYLPVKAGDEHNAPEQFIANFDESREGCTAHWIKVSAAADGAFTVTNSRNGFSKTYAGPRARE